MQRVGRAGQTPARRHDSGGVLVRERAELTKIGLLDLVLDIGRRDAAEVDGARCPSSDRVAGNLQRRDGELRIAQRRRHLTAIEVEVAYLRALNRQRAVDVVIGERRCLRREQIANGCGDAAGAGQRRPQPRIARQPRIAIAVGRRSAGCRNRLGAVGRRLHR